MEKTVAGERAKSGPLNCARGKTRRTPSLGKAENSPFLFLTMTRQEKRGDISSDQKVGALQCGEKN